MSVRRVLHVVPSLGGEDSDDCVAIRQLATALARLGIDNHVATARCSPKGAQPSGRPIVEEGVTYWHFQTHASFTTASLPMWSWLSSHIASFDVAHIHCLSPLAAAPAAVFARRHDVPYIVRPFDGPDDCVAKDRTSWWRRTRLDLLRSRVLRYAALMHFSSEAERQSVASLTAPVPSVVIPPAMPAAVAALPGGLRRRLGLAGSRQIVLATLPPDERGELAALIRAVAQMRAVVTDAVIVLVGDGPEGMDARLKAEMRAHGVGDYEMFWVGSLTAAERRSALTDARVLLAMSCSDGKGTFVKEAMDAGLPVVVSDALTIHAEIEQANAGIAVPVEAGPIARAVGSVLAHPALAAAMAAAGRELIERRYSTTAVARRVLAAYEQACGVASAVEVVPSLDAVGADC